VITGRALAVLYRLLMDELARRRCRRCRGRWGPVTWVSPTGRTYCEHCSRIIRRSVEERIDEERLRRLRQRWRRIVDEDDGGKER